jgi:hypothetical protein
MTDKTILNAKGKLGGFSQVIDTRRPSSSPTQTTSVRVMIQADRTFDEVTGYTVDGAGTVKVWGRAPGAPPVLLATKTHADFSMTAPVVFEDVALYPEMYATVEGMAGATDGFWFRDHARSGKGITTAEFIDIEPDMPPEFFAVPYDNYGTSLTTALPANEADGPIRLQAYYPSGVAPAGGWPCILRINQAGYNRNDIFGDLISVETGTATAETLLFGNLLARGFVVIDCRISSVSASNANDGGVWRAPYDIGSAAYDIAGDPALYATAANNKALKDAVFVMQWLKEYGYARYGIDGDAILINGLSGGGGLSFGLCARRSFGDESSPYPVLRHDQRPAGLMLDNAVLHLSTLATTFSAGGLWFEDASAAAGTPATDLALAKVSLERLRKASGPWWAFRPRGVESSRMQNLPIFQWQNQNISQADFSTIDLAGNPSTDPFDRPALELTRPFTGAGGLHDAWHAYMLRKQLLALDGLSGPNFHSENSDFVLVGAKVGSETVPYEPSRFFTGGDPTQDLIDSFAYKAQWAQATVGKGKKAPEVNEYAYTVIAMLF